MGKFLGLLLALAALVTALFYLVRRTEYRPRVQGRFSMLVAGFLAFMGVGCTQADKAVHQNEENKSKEVKPMPHKVKSAQEHKNWPRIKAATAQASKIEGGNFSKLNQMTKTARKEMGDLLAPLVADGLVSPAAAEVMAVIHSDRTFHYNRQLATCYMGYFQPQGCRDDMERRLALLTKAKDDGTLSPAVVEKAKRAAVRDMELMLRVTAIEDARRAGKSKAADKKSKKLMELMTKHHPKWTTVEDDDTIKVRAGVAEALNLMLELLEAPAEPKGG